MYDKRLTFYKCKQVTAPAADFKPDPRISDSYAPMLSTAVHTPLEQKSAMIRRWENIEREAPVDMGFSFDGLHPTEFLIGPR